MVRTSFAVVATTCTTLHGSADATIDPITTTTSDDLRASADTITTTTSGDRSGSADRITNTRSDGIRGSADATSGHNRDRYTKRRIGGDASYRHASIIATTTTSDQNALGASPRLSTTGSGAPTTTANKRQ